MLGWAALAAGLFACLIGISRGLGAINPIAAAAVIRPTECTQPCWRSMVPGIIWIEEVQDLLEQLAEHEPIGNVQFTDRGNSSTSGQVLCWTMSDPDQLDPRASATPTADADNVWRGCAIRRRPVPGIAIWAIDLMPPRGSLTLSEAIVMFGVPQVVIPCTRGGGDQRSFTNVEIHFANAIEMRTFQIIAEGQMPPRLAPSTMIGMIRYHALAEEPPFPFDAPVWQGYRAFPGGPGNIGC